MPVPEPIDFMVLCLYNGLSETKTRKESNGGYYL